MKKKLKNIALGFMLAATAACAHVDLSKQNEKDATISNQTVRTQKITVPEVTESEKKYLYSRPVYLNDWKTADLTRENALYALSQDGQFSVILDEEPISKLPFVKDLAQYLAQQDLQLLVSSLSFPPSASMKEFVLGSLTEEWVMKKVESEPKKILTKELFQYVAELPFCDKVLEQLAKKDPLLYLLSGLKLQNYPAYAKGLDTYVATPQAMQKVKEQAIKKDGVSWFFDLVLYHPSLTSINSKPFMKKVLEEAIGQYPGVYLRGRLQNFDAPLPYDKELVDLEMRPENLLRAAEDPFYSCAIASYFSIIAKTPHFNDVVNSLLSMKISPNLYFHLTKNVFNDPSWKSPFGLPNIEKILIPAAKACQGNYIYSTLDQIVDKPYASDLLNIYAEGNAFSFLKKWQKIKAHLPAKEFQKLAAVSYHALPSLYDEFYDQKEFSYEVSLHLNDLHNQSDKTRFAIAEHFSARQLFSIITLASEHHYPSTYFGLFERMEDKRQASRESYVDYVQQKGTPLNLLHFLEQAAYSGKLGVVFDGFRNEKEKSFFCKRAVQDFTAGASLGEGRDALLSRSIPALYEVLSIGKGKPYNTEMEKFVLDAYNMTESYALKSAFGTVISAYASETPDFLAHPQVGEIAKKYPIPTTPPLTEDVLFDAQKTNYQLVRFFDEQDAIDSFKNFVTYQTSDAAKREGWSLKDHGSFVVVFNDRKRDDGYQVVIVANNPAAGEKGAKDALAMLEKTPPSLIWMRGHSYQTEDSDDSVMRGAAFLGYGSCNGMYHNAAGAINVSPQANILVTKGIGTMNANDPLIRITNRHLLKHRKITWGPIWQQAERTIQDERFKQYINPEKNMAVRTLRAYKQIMFPDVQQKNTTPSPSAPSYPEALSAPSYPVMSGVRPPMPE